MTGFTGGGFRQNEQSRSGANQDCYPVKSYFFFAFLLLDFFGEEVLAFLPFFDFSGAAPPPPPPLEGAGAGAGAGVWGVTTGGPTTSGTLAFAIV